MSYFVTFDKLASYNWQYFSAYPDAANCTLKWLGFDREDRYNDHRKKNNTARLSLLKTGYLKNDITYKINSYGFRSDEFQDKDGVLFLGCSFTVGEGLPLTETFSQIVTESLKLKNYNLAVGGGSLGTAYRFGQYWLPKIKPKIVIAVGPGMFRYELKTKERFINLIPAMPGTDKIEKNFYKKWISEEINGLLYQSAMLNGLENICRNSKIKFLSFDIDKLILPVIENDLARDLCHPGKKTNQRIADIILENL